MIVNKALEYASPLILYKCEYIGEGQDVLYKELFYSTHVFSKRDVAELKDAILDHPLYGARITDVKISVYKEFPYAHYIGEIWEEVGLGD